MLSEKQKKTVFKQCLHELRKTEDLQNYPGLVEYYKEHRDSIISLAGDFSSEKNPLDAYKEKMNGILDFITKSIMEIAFQPMEEKRQETIDSILENIKNLRSDIKTGIIDLDKIDTSSQIGEWGGAGVIISSDRSREGHEGDLVVHTNHAKTITWLMFRLRDIASGIIDYMNKYEFYGKIAESAPKYIEKNGDSKEIRQDLLIYLLDEISCLIESWK